MPIGTALKANAKEIGSDALSAAVTALIVGVIVLGVGIAVNYGYQWYRGAGILSSAAAPTGQAPQI